MELNRFCCKCKNYEYKKITDKITVWYCKVGLNTRAPLLACACFQASFIDDTIPDDKKCFKCNTCKYSELIDLVNHFDYKCNNLDAMKLILQNEMSRFACNKYELDSDKLPIDNPIIDTD